MGVVTSTRALERGAGARVAVGWKYGVGLRCATVENSERGIDADLKMTTLLARGIVRI